MREHGSHLVGTAESTARIEALTDGVFAIVMTLMVFDIRVPLVEVGQLPQAVASLWPKFFAYAISFVQLGIYWAGHRSQFQFISRENHTLRWISLFFLALVAFIPFSTQLLSNYLGHRLGLVIYGANFIAVGVVLSWHWLYAVRRAQLVSEPVPRAVVSTAVRRTLTAPVLYAVGLLVLLVSPWATLAIYTAIPIYLFPALIDRLWFVRRAQ